MQRYLVVQLARFGDIIQTKRLLLSLMQNPDCANDDLEKCTEQPEVHLCVDESLASIAAMVYPSVILHTLKAHRGIEDTPTTVLAGNSKTFAELSSIDFAGVFILNHSPMSFAVAGLFEPEKVHGYRLHKGQQEASLWTSMAGRWIRDRRNAPVNLVDFWAHFMKNPIAPEQVNPVAHPAHFNNSSRQGKIGIVLAGRQSRRSLPTEKLANIIKAVFEARGGPEVILLGSRAEKPLAMRLMRALPNPVVQKTRDYSGATALTDLPELLQSLDLILSPDTGTMHLAAHLGVPVMAFFLSSAWCFETGPYGMGHKVWQSAPPCAPCLESAGCGNELNCLKPFSHTAFLEHLTGKYNPEWPYGLLGLTSTLDKLGTTYLVVDGEETVTNQRAGLRVLISEYLGLANDAARTFAGISGLDIDESSRELSALAHNIFNENDWILPRYI